MHNVCNVSLGKVLSSKRRGIEDMERGEVRDQNFNALIPEAWKRDPSRVPNPKSLA